jgi:hypothetical protein
MKNNKSVCCKYGAYKTVSLVEKHAERKHVYVKSKYLQASFMVLFWVFIPHKNFKKKFIFLVKRAIGVGPGYRPCQKSPGRRRIKVQYCACANKH